MKFLLAFALSLFVLPQENSAPPGPKLLVLLSVDQMRGDYLQRYRPLLTGGFKKMLGEGASFSDCTYEYANTETGPGHATLSTGRNPRKHGIVENNWFDVKLQKGVYCVDGTPRYLLTDALGDWVRAANPEAKVISISGKDRAAILMGGKKPNCALWYSTNDGNFVSNPYYSPQVPEWATAWNQKHGGKEFAGKTWERMLPEDKYKSCGASEDKFDGELIHVFGKAHFPYELDGTDGELFRQIPFTPFFDTMCLSLAREAFEAEKLGQRNVVDLLCVSLSALDYVGHCCGPHSQEAGDVFLRLDQELGQFFQFLESKLGKEGFVVGLSADHGVVELPEWGAKNGMSTRRVSVEASRALDKIQKHLKEKFGSQEWVINADTRGLYFNREICEKNKVSISALATEAAREAAKFEFVDSGWTREEVERDKEKSPVAMALWNSFHPERSVDVFFVGKEFVYAAGGRTGTGHGTPWHYDQWVPLLFWGAGVKAGMRDEKVHPVDLAPTLAMLGGISIPRDVDGKPRLSSTKQVSK